MHTLVDGAGTGPIDLQALLVWWPLAAGGQRQVIAWLVV